MPLDELRYGKFQCDIDEKVELGQARNEKYEE